jgi:ribosomal subunit interface protein
MKVIIRDRRGDLVSQTLKDYSEQHLVDRIGRFYDDPAAVLEVRFEDANGQTKGGLDQVVHLTFAMPGARLLHVSEVSDDVYKSLDLARDRLIRRIKREVARARRPVAHPIDHGLGRTAAAAERQIETIEDDEDASLPRLPHVDDQVR